MIARTFTEQSSEAQARKILGVEKDATQEEIRRAFKKLALKYHPDKHPTDKANQLLLDRWHEIEAAYEILMSLKQETIHSRLPLEYKRIEYSDAEEQKRQVHLLSQSAMMHLVYAYYSYLSIALLSSSFDEEKTPNETKAADIENFDDLPLLEEDDLPDLPPLEDDGSSDFPLLEENSFDNQNFNPAYFEQKHNNELKPFQADSPNDLVYRTLGFGEPDEKLVCPVLRQLYTDPVLPGEQWTIEQLEELEKDGIERKGLAAIERSALEYWAQKSNKHPLDRKPFEVKNLVPDKALAKEAKQFLERKIEEAKALETKLNGPLAQQENTLLPLPLEYKRINYSELQHTTSLFNRLGLFLDNLTSTLACGAAFMVVIECLMKEFEVDVTDMKEFILMGALAFPLFINITSRSNEQKIIFTNPVGQENELKVGQQEAKGEESIHTLPVPDTASGRSNVSSLQRYSFLSFNRVLNTLNGVANGLTSYFRPRP